MTEPMETGSGRTDPAGPSPSPMPQLTDSDDPRCSPEGTVLRWNARGGRNTEPDVKLLFAWEWYDGPLDGALEWNGKRYWFRFTGDCMDAVCRHADVMDLSDEDWIRVDRQQALFEEWVGTHYVYDRETQKRDLSGVKRTHHLVEGVPHPYWDRDDPDKDWEPSGPKVATVLLWELKEGGDDAEAAV